MAAIDPGATPEHSGTTNGDTKPRATLKLVYDTNPGQDSDSDEESEEDAKYLRALLADRESGEEDEDEDEEEADESSSDEEEKNGGPSDPSKTKKARKEAALQQMMKALAEAAKDDSEDEMEMDGPPQANGLSKTPKLNKGKGKAVAEKLEDESLGEDGSEDSLDGMEEVVVCTLDPEKVGKFSEVPDTV